MSCLALLGHRPIFAGMKKWSVSADRTTLVKRTPVRSTVANLSCRALLLNFPSRLIYVASCRCWRLKKYVDLNPGGEAIKGTLNFPDTWTLKSEFTEIGEVLVAEDGLIHPDDLCESKSSSKQSRPMLIAEVKWPIRFYRMCYDLALYLNNGNPEPDFPADYKAPEPQHVWEIPEGDRSSTPDTTRHPL